MKEKAIFFRIETDTKERLVEIARNERRSVASLVDYILHKYLLEQNGKQSSVLRKD
jgi:hypothetical protein